MKVSASVYMTLKVEVHVGNWEASQPFEQLHQQAEREAKRAISNVFGTSGKYRVINEPAVMHVVTKESA